MQDQPREEPFDPGVFDREADYWLAKKGVPEGLGRPVEPYCDRGCSLLDLGCGGGRLAAALAPRFARVTGLDTAVGLVQRAREIYPDVRFVVGDCLDENVWRQFGDPFDLIVSNCSIRRDYTPDLFRLSALMHGHLGPGGGIALRVQADGDLSGLLPRDVSRALLFDEEAVRHAFARFAGLTVTRQAYRQRFSSRAYLVDFLGRIGVPLRQIDDRVSGPLVATRVAWIVSGRVDDHGGSPSLAVP